ncbi:MAG: hypothetical protein Q4D85_02660 [Corynebacterium sp.]|uniref:hypothetical protein n=1 Tax=Corynebacterium sp. TaxID=1720 RepID=UPI0026DAE426|nr:hypothetical protein [Corynebacterium sp.]MDO5097631.1 hypothetical protein [Corynebacterium sp.]
MRKFRIPVLALATSVALSGISVAHANAQLPPAPPVPAVESAPAPVAGEPQINQTGSILDLSTEIYYMLPGDPQTKNGANALFFSFSNGVVGLAALVLAGLVFLLKPLFNR